MAQKKVISERNLWKKLKNETPKISWIRLENWALLGTPDLLGYAPSGHFFTVELKSIKSLKIQISAHQISFHVKHPTYSFILVQTPDQSCPKLYTGAMVQELVAKGTDACSLPLAAWGLLLEACSLQLDAWSL